MRQKSKYKNTRSKQLNRLSLQAKALATGCLQEVDLHACVQKTISHKRNSDKKKFFFYLHLANQLSEAGDNITAMHYLLQAQICNKHLGATELSLVIKKLVALNNLVLAQSLVMSAALSADNLLNLTTEEKQKISKAHKAQQTVTDKKVAHGQDLLLSSMPTYIARLQKKEAGKKTVLLEIGTTREDVPGQGSTKQFAQFCLKHDLHFITVDMDSQNTERAKQMFAEIGAEHFEAIHMKGEDFLSSYQGELDFVFLDAYDFDHGNHSELRQSRYQKFLGSNISDEQCHRMHLVCAAHVVKNLSQNGLVCMDDTWLDDAAWTAKGTLAMPYFLSHGFELVDVRNRAALLRRSYPALHSEGSPA